jgi:hypothetical protein
MLNLFLPPINKIILGILLISSAIGYHYYIVYSLESKLNYELETNSKLSNAIQNQNSEVDKYKAIGVEYEKLMISAVEKNNKEQKRMAEEIGRLKSANIPKDCSGAMSFLKSKTTESGMAW